MVHHGLSFMMQACGKEFRWFGLEFGGKVREQILTSRLTYFDFKRMKNPLDSLLKFLFKFLDLEIHVSTSTLINSP